MKRFGGFLSIEMEEPALNRYQSSIGEPTSSGKFRYQNNPPNHGFFFFSLLAILPIQDFIFRERKETNEFTFGCVTVQQLSDHVL